MKRLTKLIFGAALLAAPAPGWAAGNITFKAPTVYPEGVAYNAKTGEFLVSSMRKGTIGAVKPDGKYREFIKDPLLISSVGLHVDAERNRLLACVSDPGPSVKTSPKTQRKIARLMAFDLGTGKRLKTIELAAPEGDHFCNDIAIDEAGNAYVTDSMAPFVYKVDPAYKASVFVRNDLFQGIGFNLNGIVHHKDGFLIVAKSNDGTLFKIDEKDTTKVDAVKLEAPLPNADGLLWTSGGDLVVIQNQDHRVSLVKSTDGWKTAKVAKSVTLDATFPTTGVEVDGKIYVLQSHLFELFSNPKTAKTDTFGITEVSF